MSEALHRPIRRNPRMGHAVGRTARCFTQRTYGLGVSPRDGAGAALGPHFPLWVCLNVSSIDSVVAWTTVSHGEASLAWGGSSSPRVVEGFARGETPTIVRIDPLSPVAIYSSPAPLPRLGAHSRPRVVSPARGFC